MSVKTKLSVSANLFLKRFLMQCLRERRLVTEQLEPPRKGLGMLQGGEEGEGKEGRISNLERTWEASGKR